MNGLLNLSDVAQIDVEESAFEKRKLEEGDIIVEKSGGSSTQAVGRVVLFKNDGEYSFSNFTMRLRLTNNDLNSTFLYLVLNSYYQKGYTFDMQNGASGLKNLDTNKYLSLQIPFPPMEIQKKIVEECNIVDEEYESSKRRIDECKKEIDNIFVDIKKQNIQSDRPKERCHPQELHSFFCKLNLEMLDLSVGLLFQRRKRPCSLFGMQYQQGHRIFHYTQNQQQIEVGELKDYQK